MIAMLFSGRAPTHLHGGTPSRMRMRDLLNSRCELCEQLGCHSPAFPVQANKRRPPAAFCFQCSSALNKDLRTQHRLTAGRVLDKKRLLE